MCTHRNGPNTASGTECLFDPHNAIDQLVVARKPRLLIGGLPYVA